MTLPSSPNVVAEDAMKQPFTELFDNRTNQTNNIIMNYNELQRTKTKKVLQHYIYIHRYKDSPEIK